MIMGRTSVTVQVAGTSYLNIQAQVLLSYLRIMRLHAFEPRLLFTFRAFQAFRVLHCIYNLNVLQGIEASSRLQSEKGSVSIQTQ